jgi:hypothetical protein
MKTTRYIGFLPFLALLGGCSPSGWAVKDIPDGSGIVRGEAVTIIRHDGMSVTGTYAGLETIPAAEYLEQYRSATGMDARGRNLPDIGQKVRVLTSLAETKVWEGRLIGFDARSLWVKLEGKDVPAEFYFSTLASLSGKGTRSLQRMELRELFLSGQIPLMTALVVETENGRFRVPVSGIRELLLRPAGEVSDVRIPGAYILSSRMQ